MPVSRGDPVCSPVRFATVSALVLALTLGACAKRHLYPGERRPDAEVARIEADRFLLANVEIDIDGTAVGSLAQLYLPPGVAGGLPGGARTGASVLPGTHRLDVRIARYGWIGAERRDCASLTFAGRAGAVYRLSIDDDTVRLTHAPAGTLVTRAPLARCR